MSCSACFSGAQHEGTPKGTNRQLHGYNTYITPADYNPNNPTILYLPDFFSHNLVNNKLLADRYAAAGFNVIFPDIILWGGAPASYMPTFEAMLAPESSFLTKLWANIMALPLLPLLVFGMPPRRFPEVLRYARAVKESLPAGAKLGAAGFCWGGYCTTHLCKESVVPGGTERLLDAQFCGHPGLLKTPVDILEAVNAGVPYSIAVAELDFQFNGALALETEAALREQVSVSETEGDRNYEVRIYKGAHHGFCVRAKPDVKEDVEGSEQAVEQAIVWFKKHLT